LSDMFTHLWSSTLLLVIILVVSRFLPLTARTRYALLLCGLLKFAIPSSAITAPLRALGIDLANLGRESVGTISIQWLEGPLTVGTLVPQSTSRWPEMLAIAWILPAAILAIVWAVARRRLVATALGASSSASPREHSALSAARRQLGLRASVEVRRSAICEAPAVVRIIRPVIVLPDGACDTLDDGELESLLRHECAHVARRDNFLGLAESALVAAFWFHPLVWITQRAMATAREQACDETAAATPDALETYVSALSKICRAVLVPRLAGVSCMASAHLKERLNHLMRYDLLRTRALSHRLVVASAAIALLAVTLGSGLRAAASSSHSKDTPFKLTFVVRPGDLPDTLDFAGRVVEASTGLLLAKPNVSFKRGSKASISTVVENRAIYIEIRDIGSRIDALMRVSENGARKQESVYSAVPEADGPRDRSGRRYTGQPISLDLKDADVKNVLDMFARITDTEIQYPSSLQGKVNLDVKDMPWDQAFDLILQQNNLSYELEGSVIMIKQ
jgi:beta-lactamase regulating signal transducer with metallopeptidase domain